MKNYTDNQNRSNRKAHVSMIGLLLVGFWASAASAGIVMSTSWGPISVVDTYSGKTITIGQASGVTGKDNTYGDQIFVNFSSVKDTYVNKHAVYGEARWYFNGTFCYPTGMGTSGCGSGWYGDGNSQTSRTSATIDPGALRKNLKGTASSARAGAKVCEDRGTLGKDKCSSERFNGFSY